MTLRNDSNRRLRWPDTEPFTDSVTVLAGDTPIARTYVAVDALLDDDLCDSLAELKCEACS